VSRTNNSAYVWKLLSHSSEILRLSSFLIVEMPMIYMIFIEIVGLHCVTFIFVHPVRQELVTQIRQASLLFFSLSQQFIG